MDMSSEQHRSIWLRLIAIAVLAIFSAPTWRMLIPRSVP
jgi:hypothetical protein